MKYIVPLIGLLAAFPPMATDMYLPAIPLLQQEWELDFGVINLSLVLFFASFSIFLLIHGPLSDRFGRRPVLLTGISLYILSSLMCSLAVNVYVLIVFRICQAAGAAAASALAMAVCKDLFDGMKRERVLAQIAVIIAIAPMVAPILGGWLIKFLNWSWIFVFQAALGFGALIGVYLMKEPLPESDRVPKVSVLKPYFRLFANGRYLSFNFIVAVSMLPMFSFIGGASDIYINGFGLDEQAFGLIFGFNAVGMMLGPLICGRLIKRLPRPIILNCSFTGITVGGICLLLFGGAGPWSMAVPMFLITFSIGLGRPLTNNLTLEQAKKEAGAASSLMIFTYFVGGAMAMGLISLNWQDKVNVLALVATLAGVTVLTMWLYMQKVQSRSRAEASMVS